ncbi:MAG: phosphate transporter substrate-binding protein, partial [Verrucomicrobia bacterium]|nr:phosphate transporter substrate-binding protein [Verrucomicrobiota bacterium]
MKTFPLKPMSSQPLSQAMHRARSFLRLAGAVLLASSVLLKADDVKFPSDYIPTHYDLSDLPIYQPEHRLLGTIRVYGTPLEGLVGKWMAAFRGEYHGQIRLSAYLINTSQAFAGLVTGQADIGLMGHRTWLTSRRAFERVYGNPALEIKFANGSYDEPQPVGTTPGLIFIVNKNNPLTSLTVEQLDGIYGTQRTGGWDGTKWTTAAARGPEKNIRTWGQLGLTGEWADKPIKPYGSDVTISNWDDLVQQVAFHGGTKW